MEYGKFLIAEAAKKCGGSRYALSKESGIAQSRLSEALSGKRAVPLSWAVPLAVIAGIDPVAAHARLAAERAEKKPRRAGSGAAGVVATLLSSYGISVGHHPELLAWASAVLDSLRIVSTTGSSLFIRTRKTAVWVG